MQKFVIKKISRSTNITISSTEEQNLNQCSDQVQLKPPDDDNHLENQISSVRMSGYLKKKRNFGGWSKLFFVLQNSLLMSYNSKEEYEEHLKSFKDVILIIPGTTVLLPSLEPRFTIASNLNTFYTFRCDDNKTCSKWITALLECLTRDVSTEFIGKKNKALSTSSSSSTSSTTSHFLSQQNLSNGIDNRHQSRYSKRHPTNHSWENLQGSNKHTHVCVRHYQNNNNSRKNFIKNTKSNWIVNHNGRILLELNMLNCNRAKLPIASQTAKILKNCTDNDVIRTTKKINFLPNGNDENNQETKVAHDTHHILEKPDQFRLHNDSTRKQSREVNRISKMFPSVATAAASAIVTLSESESQRPEKLTQSNGTTSSNEIGIEEQEQAMSFGEEYSLFATGDYASVDSSRFNNKLNIENTYSEVETNPNGRNDDYVIPNVKTKWIKTSEPLDLPEYSVVDLTKKYQERLRKVKQENEEKMSNLIKNLNIYEDIEIKNSSKNDESNIYELIDIPTTTTKKSRTLIWKKLPRINIFDIFKQSTSSEENSTSSRTFSPDVNLYATLRKRHKISLTLTDFSKHFNYRSMRSKAKKFYRKSNSTT
ncbi:hypothetical protein PVAND_014097 [Polypedilum vanderplanki]|uniref:PH domain-containing protein n=1 Tax=Polypedilum vanderplanki TaxID=319348 RepID=A0A9J6CSN9_POLVA|nr:hypothetical protein PVAND_014097 [Polypedilum vanderplanki]